MKQLSKEQIWDLSDLCCEKTIFGNEKFLAGTSHQFRTNKDFYIRKIAEESFRLGQLVAKDTNNTSKENNK